MENKKKSILLFLMQIAAAIIFFTIAEGCKNNPSSSAGTVAGGSASVYYVDAAAGNDSATGNTESTAWKTLSKVNSSSFKANDKILFKRGETWREQLVPKSGDATGVITYGAYGSGAKPILLGSLNKSLTSDWVSEGANIWKSASTFSTDVGNIIFNNASTFGIKKWTLGALTNQGDYFFDRSTSILRIYSTASPGSFYSNIECALRNHIVNNQGVSYATFENLNLKYGAAHGFGGGNTAFLTIRDNEISFIGGGDLNQDGTNIRFGNGIEFWANAHDHIVERNKIWEIYDTGLTNQNHTTAAQQYNITYRNNLIWNCAYSSFEYWNRPAASMTSNIRFENNTALNAGYGWGTQRPVAAGVHVLLDQNDATTSGIYIQNNVFYNSTGRNLYVKYDYQWSGKLISNYNAWYQSAGIQVELNNIATTYTTSQFATYVSYASQDANSITSDPLLMNVGGLDFKIQTASPCKDTGVNNGISSDYDSFTRPFGSALDMGAYEFH